MSIKDVKNMSEFNALTTGAGVVSLVDFHASRSLAGRLTLTTGD